MNIPTLLTVKQFTEKHPAFPEGGLRHQIFHEQTNGLAKAGAIVRVGRKVLIDEDKYFHWIQKSPGFNKALEPQPSDRGYSNA